jgi:peptidyl-prolyl cis-trans isomerase SurA
MKRLVLVTVFLVLSATYSNAEGIAAVVNSDVVTDAQIRELVIPKDKKARETLQGAALENRLSEIRREAIDDLIDRALILQEFKRKGGVVTESLIDERIEGIVRDSFGGDRLAFLRAIALQGFTPEKFREHQRDVVAVEMMRRDAENGASDDSSRQHQLREWLAGLRKKAFIKIYGTRE